MKQKTGNGKASVTLSTETQHSLTSGNSTDRWRAALRTPTSPNLIDASGAVLKTNEEKGSALLQRFAQQSSQDNLDERKAVCKGLDRTLAEAGSNDDLITELESTEAFPGLSKDTAPGPDKVKYSDIKNLSVNNKSDLFRLYGETFATGQVPEDWSHSYVTIAS